MSQAVIDLINYYWVDILTVINTLGLIIFGVKPRK